MSRLQQRSPWFLIRKRGPEMNCERARMPHSLVVVLLCFGLATVSGCGRRFMRDIATDALDPGNLSDTEPSIAVNPHNHKEVGIVTFSENWTPAKGAPVWKSTDHGATWNKY